MKLLTAQGIGDSVWSLFKARAIAARFPDSRIDLRIACWHDDPAEDRALPFLRRFSFLNSVHRYVMPRGAEGPLLLPGEPADADGAYRYIPDGPHPELDGVDFVAIPNSALEKGVRLEDWLPDYPITWDVMRSFEFLDTERAYAETLAEAHGRYVVFFMSSAGGNGPAGHNRMSVWTPEQWVALGELIHEKFGATIIVVGATWDLDYWHVEIAPRVRGRAYWRHIIGQLTVCETLAVIDRARFVVSYQSGLGIVSHYLRRPTVMWWRKYGDSISPVSYVSPREEMATAWAYPDWQRSGLYMPCIYGRETVEDIVAFAERNEW